MSDSAFEENKRSLRKKRIYELMQRADDLRETVQRGSYDDRDLEELAAILSAIRYDLVGNDTRLSEAIGLPGQTIAKTYSGKNRPKFANFIKMIHGAKKILAREASRKGRIELDLDSNKGKPRVELHQKPIRLRSKRSSILLNEESLVRVQQLAKQSETTISSIIDQALKVYSLPNTRARAGAAQRRETPEAILISNRAEIIRYSRAIIVALEETLQFDSTRHHNLPPPALRLDDPTYLAEIRSLTNELHQLNGLLEKPTKKTPRVVKQQAGRFGKHLDKFLNNYATSLGKGAAALTIATAVGLLCKVGISQEIIDAIWAHARLR
jgi:hypothetical protein